MRPWRSSASCDQPFGAAGRDDVERDRGDTVELAQAVDRAGAGDHEGPFARERAHDGQADPLAAAADDSDLPAQFEVHCSPSPELDLTTASGLDH